MSFSPDLMKKWEEKVRSELKGASPQSIHAEQLSGLVIKTLYTQEDLPSQQTGFAQKSSGWNRSQRIAQPSVVDANHQILEDLSGGISNLWLHFSNVFETSRDGIKVDSTEEWTSLLQGVQGELISLILSAEDSHRLSKYLRSIEPSLTSFSRINWCYDPLAAMAKYGIEYSDLIPQSREHFEWCQGKSKDWRPLCIDLSSYHLAGATAVHELAILLATAAEYSRWFPELNMAQLAELCWIHMPIDRDVFENVAKLRAARRLWAGIGNASGQQDIDCTIHAYTSERMLTYFDQWVNILRSTTACSAAIWGGADIISNIPHDFLHWEDSSLGARVARNIHSVLDEESHLGQISDPTAGSYYVESLTESYCTMAWGLFQEIEAQGGLQKLISTGALFSELNRSLTERQGQIESRILAITGVTEFANSAEHQAEEEEREGLMSAALCEASIRQIIEKEDGKRILSSTFPGLNRVRDAGWIESTRASISTQTVFLATLGSESEWKPRATFARNFFAIMGWTVEEYSGLSSIEALTALSTAMVDSGAELCCICGSNERYASELSAVVKALSPLSKLVMLAGKDRDSLVDVELYRGVNIREAWSAILHSTMNGESQ